MKPSSTESRERRQRSFLLAVGLLAVIAVLTAVETYIQGKPTSSSLAVDFLIYLLSNLNYLLMTVLIILVFRYLVKLALERRRGALGSRFQMKLVIAFIAVSIIPATTLFLAASSFITRSVDLLFAPEISSLSEASEGVAQAFYRNGRDQALFFAGRLAQRITDDRLLNVYNLETLQGAVSKIQEESNLGVVQVFSATGEELVRSVNPTIPREQFASPTSESIRKALGGESSTSIDEVGEGEFIRGIVPVRSTFKLEETVGAVVVNTFIPHSLRQRVAVMARVSRDYHLLKARRNPITSSYVNLLFMITLLVIFSAIWLGTYLAKGITIPIQKLAEATNAVAEGNLDFKVSSQANDEVGILIDSFNRMTDDLKTNKLEIEEANLTLQRAILELDRKGRYLETLLESIDTGVISLDPQGIVTTYNLAAKRMLGLPAEKVLSRSFQKIFRKHPFHPIHEVLELAERSGEEVEREIRLPLPTGTLTLMTYCTPLADEHGERLGVVAVFDNLTDLVTAQKMAAWKEVAQRIAHEIKNPLTPVKLSAQRLLRKFTPANPEEAAVYRECIDTIIRQVDDIKGLVDAFSRFARMPETHPVPTDLDLLVNEVVAMYRDTHGQVRLVTSLAGNLPTLQLDPEQIKRALVNLVENAVESMPEGGTVTIATHHRRREDAVLLEVSDQGVGVPPEDRDRIFLPYFSTKSSGTGLGLAIVHQIVTENKGTIHVGNNAPKGTVFSILFPLAGAVKESPPMVRAGDVP